jgi:hypothetical protein
MSIPSLLFVYAVDGGLLSTVRDYAHKLLSPQTYPCKLCGLTYGALGQAPAWSCLVRSLPLQAKFLHRNELSAQYPHLSQQPLPTVLLERGDGSHEELIAAGEINQCANTDELVALVRARVERVVTQ